MASNGHQKKTRCKLLPLLVLCLLGVRPLAFAKTPTISSPARVPTPIAVAAGGSHSCAVMSSGAVQCWGFNTYGELGDGTMRHQTSPVWVQGLRDATAIVAGGRHTCAIDAKRLGWCWGWNAAGQLGDGTTKARLTPQPVTEVNNMVALALGTRHSCALTGAQTVWCWGNNAYGQLGDGTTDSRPVPHPVPGLANVVQLTAGDYHTCARTNDGNVWCWGWNLHGQVGQSPQDAIIVTPSQVPTLKNVRELAAGGIASCAVTAVPVKTRRTKHARKLDALSATPPLTEKSRLQCFGALMQHDHPIPIGFRQPFTELAAISIGDNYICERSVQGDLACYGTREQGETGNGIDAFQWRYVKLSSLHHIAQLASGSHHSCALDHAGSVWCFGSDQAGALGNGRERSVNTPVRVPLRSDTPARSMVMKKARMQPQ